MSEQIRPIVSCPECATKVRLPANIAPGDALACPNCSAEISPTAAEPRDPDRPKTVLPPRPERAVKLDIDGLVVRDSVTAPNAFDNDQHVGPDFDHPEKLASTDDEEFAADENEEPLQRFMRPDERRKIIGWDEDSAGTDVDSGGAPPVASAASLKFILMATPFIIAAIVFAIVARPKKLEQTPSSPPPSSTEQIASVDGQQATGTPTDAPKLTEMLERFSADELFDFALERMEHFLRAEGIEERLRHCRAKERVRPLMESHYSGKEAGPVAFRSITDKDMIGDFIFLDVEMQDYSTRPAVLVPNAQLDGFEVDWETFVGYSEMSLQRFIAEKPTAPVLMRLVARPDDYFNFGFSEETHACIAFEETSGNELVYGYAPRDSPIADEFRGEFRTPSRSKYFVVRLKYPEGAEIPNQVLIEEIVAKGWLIE